MIKDLKWCTDYMAGHIGDYRFPTDHGTEWVLKTLKAYQNKFAAIEALLAKPNENSEMSFRRNLVVALTGDPVLALEGYLKEKFKENSHISDKNMSDMLALLKDIRSSR